MKKLILMFMALGLLAGLANVKTAYGGSNADAGANATASLVYAPVSNYNGGEKRFFPYITQPHLFHPQQASLPKGFSFYNLKPLANTFKKMRWEGKPDDKNCVVTAYFRNPPNNNPIEWIEAVPAGDNDMLLGFLAIDGDDDEKEQDIVKRAVHNAKFYLGATRIQIAKRTRHKAAQWGISTGQGGTYGQTLGKSDSPDDKMVVLGAGSILGYSKHWMDEFADVIVYVYNEAPEQAEETIVEMGLPAEIAAAGQTLTPRFVVAPIFLDLDEYDKINGQPIETYYKDRINQIAKVIYDGYSQGAPGKVHFAGVCDNRGTELYNMGILGPKRSQYVMNLVASECAGLGMPMEAIARMFVFTSAGESNVDNPEFFFDNHNLNRRVDVVWAVELTSLPKPELLNPEK